MIFKKLWFIGSSHIGISRTPGVGGPRSDHFGECFCLLAIRGCDSQNLHSLYKKSLDFYYCDSSITDEARRIE